jgi:hypothetical protein
MPTNSDAKHTAVWNTQRNTNANYCNIMQL